MDDYASSSEGHGPNLAANVPQTDREWLMRVEGKLDQVIDKIQGPDGKGGLCGRIESHEKAIRLLQNWQWKVVGGLVVLGALEAGRYVVGPTNWSWHP